MLAEFTEMARCTAVQNEVRYVYFKNGMCAHKAINKKRLIIVYLFGTGIPPAFKTSLPGYYVIKQLEDGALID